MKKDYHLKEEKQAEVNEKDMHQWFPNHKNKKPFVSVANKRNKKRR